MNVADDNGQHLSPRGGLHAAGHMLLGAFLRHMKLGCEARDHFRCHELVVGIQDEQIPAGPGLDRRAVAVYRWDTRMGRNS